MPRRVGGADEAGGAGKPLPDVHPGQVQTSRQGRTPVEDPPGQRGSGSATQG